MLPSGLDAQFGTPYPRSAGFDTDSHARWTRVRETGEGRESVGERERERSRWLRGLSLHRRGSQGGRRWREEGARASATRSVSYWREEDDDWRVGCLLG